MRLRATNIGMSQTGNSFFIQLRDFVRAGGIRSEPDIVVIAAGLSASDHMRNLVYSVARAPVGVFGGSNLIL